MKKLFNALFVLCIIITQMPTEFTNLKANSFAEPIADFHIDWTTPELSGVVEYDDTNTTVSLTPSKNTADANGAFITAQVKLNLTKAQIQAETIEIRLPKMLFTDRDGQAIGTYSIGLPKDPQGNSSFRYSESVDGTELIITNTREITDAMQVLFDITYYACDKNKNTQKPSNITSGYSTSLSASLTAPDGTMYPSNELHLDYHTKTTLLTLNKGKHKKWINWQKEWGPKPADADDYAYICWRINGTFDENSTRPFDLKIEDTLSNNGSMVGWYEPVLNKYTYVPGHITFVPSTSTTYQLSVPVDQGHTYFITYAVVRYPKDQLMDGQDIKNDVTASISDTYAGEDQPLNQTLSATAAYTYSDVHFDPPKGENWLGKQYVNGNVVPSTLYGYMEAIQNANIGDVLPETEGQWYNFVDQTTGQRTVKPGDDVNDPQNYGKVPYSIELTDDFIALENERLLKGDYQFNRVTISYDLKNISFNEDTGRVIGESDTNYATWEPVTLYIQTEIDGPWQELGKAICYGKDQFRFTYTNGDHKGETIDNLTKNYIPLPEGSIGARLTSRTTHYGSSLRLYVKTQLIKSEHVMQLIDHKSEVELRNINSERFFDENGIWLDPQLEQTITGTLADAVKERDRLSNQSENFCKHSTTSVKLVPMVHDSKMGKYVDNSKNDAANQRFKITYISYVYEDAISDYFDPFESYTDMTGVKEQRQGTFYDLLPKGMYVDVNTIHVMKANRVIGYPIRPGEKVNHTVELKENWQGSGRTMMIVHADVPAELSNHIKYNVRRSEGWDYYSGFSIQYDAYYSWESFFDYGGNLHNSIAYQTKNPAIAGGYQDAPQNSFLDYEWMKDLDGDGVFGETSNAPANTLYADASLSISGDASSELGYFKKVKNQQDAQYSSETEVLSGEYYSYRLNYSAKDDNANAKGIVFYDVLETNAKDRENWQGSFVGVDLSAAQAKDIEPVVYYSTKEGLVLDASMGDQSGNADLTDPAIWSTSPPDDLSKVTAVAIDLSKKKDGSDFILEKRQQVSTLVYMQAPTEGVKDLMDQKAKAYNTSWVRSEVQLASGIPKPDMLETTETTVGIKLPQISIHKESDPVSGSADAPAQVQKKDPITYDLKITNEETALYLNDILVEDTIPKGLEIDFDNIKFYLGDDPANAELISNSSVADVQQDGQKLTFSIPSLMKGQVIHLLIPVQVEDNDFYGYYENTAKIIQVNKHPHEETSETTYHEKKAKQTSLTFTKVNKEGEALAQAKFVLYGLACEDPTHSHDELLDVDAQGALITSSPCWKMITSAASDANGSVSFDPIDVAREYRLIEYEAPVGYVLPKGQWIVEYDETDGQLKVTGSIANPPAVETKEDGRYEIRNYRPQEIPITGSGGITWFVSLGVGCMAAGTGMLWKKKQKKEGNEER